MGVFEVKECNDTEVVKKLDNQTCEAKRLFIMPEYRGKGYARIMLNTMLERARELGFEEVSEKEGIVTMRMEINK